VRRLGANTHVRVSIGSDEIEAADERPGATHATGDPVRIRLDDYVLFDAGTGGRIDASVS
jgi:hypothetical protein